MLTVGYLVVDSHRMTAEEESARQWLSRSKQFGHTTIEAADLADPASLTGVDVLWWHYDAAVSLPEILLRSATREVVNGFLRAGGGMLLSLLAAPYVVDLGIESVRPSDVRKGPWGETCWAEDYPDIRGFGGFLGHPLFAGLGGGVFTWNPVPTTPFAGAYYTAPALPQKGKIIAVERQYIRLNEDRRVLTEYDVGKGKLLVAGAFMYFASDRGRFRQHLERFTENCFRYASDYTAARNRGVPPLSNSRPTYWSFAPREVHTASRPPARVVFGPPTLPEMATGLSLTREPGAIDRVIDVGGLRMMVMGKEKKGIEEIWCHPFRLLMDYRVGVRAGDGGLVWLDTVAPIVTVRPESVTRVFMVGEARIEETIFSSQGGPSAGLHYHVDTNHPLDLVISASVDLRLMWPLSENATGSLWYSWDEALQGAVVTNGSRELVAILGCSRKAEEHIVGRCTGFGMADGLLAAVEDPLVRVGVALRFRLDDPHTDMLVACAGSDSGETEAVTAYRSMVEDPGGVLSGQVKYYRQLFGEMTVLDCPDEEFALGSRWALVGTDRFFVETPKLGRSLMAGFGTTERGWDGGQKISGRPGYAWYFGRDGVWTAFAMLDYGDFAKVRDVIEFFGKYQDLSGKIYHELTSSGQVHYDAADSTPLYLILIGRYLEATGDAEFVRREFPHLLKAMKFCASTDTDGDGLIENTNVGHGWVEGGKLFPVHTEIYLAAAWAEALRACANVAQVLGEQALSEEWKKKSEQVRKRVQSDFWNPKTSFYNFGKYADGSYNTEKTILAAVATYFECTSEGQERDYVAEYARATFTSDWGVRIVGTDCSFYNPRGYHSGSVWPLFTGWASLAEFSALRPLQGYLHLMDNLQLYRPFASGYLEEVLRGDRCEPAGVCSHQAWSESMVLQPMLEGMLGLKVNAKENRLILRPYFPPQWDHANVSNVRVGGSKVHMQMHREKGETRYTFVAEGNVPVRVHFQPLLPPLTTLMDVRVGNETVLKGNVVRTYVDSPQVSFDLTEETEVVIRHSGGVAMVPPISLEVPGESSAALRVLQERWTDEGYEIDLEGIGGKSYTVSIYDPDSEMTDAVGATVERREDPMTQVSVSFGAGGGKGMYVNKTVRLTGRRGRG